MGAWQQRAKLFLREIRFGAKKSAYILLNTRCRTTTNKGIGLIRLHDSVVLSNELYFAGLKICSGLNEAYPHL